MMTTRTKKNDLNEEKRIRILQLITVAPFLDVIEPVALIYALTGFVVGVFGSLLSIRKFLKV